MARIQAFEVTPELASIPMDEIHQVQVVDDNFPLVAMGTCRSKTNLPCLPEPSGTTIPTTSPGMVRATGLAMTRVNGLQGPAGANLDQSRRCCCRNTTTLSKPIAHLAPAGCHHSTRLLWRLCTGDVVSCRSPHSNIAGAMSCWTFPIILGACTCALEDVMSSVGHLPPVLGAGWGTGHYTATSPA